MKSRTVVFFFLIALLPLVTSCTSKEKTRHNVEIILSDEYQEGLLRIKVCPINFDLEDVPYIKVVVTENTKWDDKAKTTEYSRYFDKRFISSSNTGDVQLFGQWDEIIMIEPSCYEIRQPNAFLETNEWKNRGMCPFDSITVTANPGNKGVIYSKPYDCNIKSIKELTGISGDVIVENNPQIEAPPPVVQEPSIPDEPNLNYYIEWPENYNYATTTKYRDTCEDWDDLPDFDENAFCNILEIRDLSKEGLSGWANTYSSGHHISIFVRKYPNEQESLALPFSPPNSTWNNSVWSITDIEKTSISNYPGVKV